MLKNSYNARAYRSNYDGKSLEPYCWLEAGDYMLESKTHTPLLRFVVDLLLGRPTDRCTQHILNILTCSDAKICIQQIHQLIESNKLMEFDFKVR